MSKIQRLPTPFSYSAAVLAGSQVYLALHRGFADDFEGQCRGAIDGMQKTLEQVNLGIDSLVKINVWLKNVSDLPTMEKIVHEYFAPGGFPARMTATTEFFDADCLIMIDGVAFIEE